MIVGQERRLKLKARISRWVKDKKSPTSAGPESRLWERLRCEKCVRFLSDERNIPPLRPLDGNCNRMIRPPWSQVMPSHWQQSTEAVQFNEGEDWVIDKEERALRSARSHACFVDIMEENKRMRMKPWEIGWPILDLDYSQLFSSKRMYVDIYSIRLLRSCKLIYSTTCSYGVHMCVYTYYDFVYNILMASKSSKDSLMF